MFTVKATIKGWETSTSIHFRKKYVIDMSAPQLSLPISQRMRRINERFVSLICLNPDS